MWIEVHQSLATHRKTGRLLRRLGITRNEAIGIVVTLWLWAMDNAPDGVLAGIEANDIADALRWDNDPKQLLDALIGAGFIDQASDRLVIHDWMEYNGRIIEKRRSDAARKKEQRLQLTRNPSSPSDVQRTSGAHPADVQPISGVPNTTVEYPTTPNGPNGPIKANTTPPTDTRRATPDMNSCSSDQDIDPNLDPTQIPAERALALAVRPDFAMNSPATVLAGGLEATDNQGFERLWANYPLRQGRKLGKQAARQAYDNVSLEDRPHLLQAVDHYREYCLQANRFPVDAKKFIGEELWREFIGPAEWEGSQNERTYASAKQQRSGRDSALLEKRFAGWQTDASGTNSN